MTDQNFQAIAQLLTSAKDFKQKIEELPDIEFWEISSTLAEAGHPTLDSLKNQVETLISLIKPE